MRQLLQPRLGPLQQYPARPLILTQPKTPTCQTTLPSMALVTPSFNQGPFLERTLQSVLAQNYPDLCYHVQDGASSDETLSILKRYQDRISSWSSEPDSGQTHAINLGFSRTQGDIMAWINSDDVLLPGTLHTVAHYFQKHPHVDVLYGNRCLIDVHDQDIGRWILPGHCSKVLAWADYIPQETLFWRRGLWERSGGSLDESFQFAMDWDLVLRFKDVGAVFAHLPFFLGAFRIHEAQKTLNAMDELGIHEMNRLRKRHLGHVPTQTQIRKAILPYLLRHVFWDRSYWFKKRIKLTT